MRKILAVLMIIIAIAVSQFVFAQQRDSREILKEGILGAGAGAVGGAASGAEGRDLWKGALAGAGVNIVGGMLLDAISGEQVGTVNEVESMNSQSAYNKGYQEGFRSGYKQGYTEGYKSNLKEGSGTE